MDVAGLRERLIGTWSLVRYELTMESGEIVLPFGEAPIGRIHYGPDGFMTAHLMRAGRDRIECSSESLSGEAAAKVLADHFSYCGSFRCESDLVIHSVEVATMPNWVGGEQRREVSFDGELLVLSAGGVRHGDGRGRAALTWAPLKPL
jgi:hypothetical protein